MSFPLKRLLESFESNMADKPSERGHGASAVVAFYVYLGIQEPTTADLTENILLAIQHHIRAELPKAAAEAGFFIPASLAYFFFHS